MFNPDLFPVVEVAEPQSVVTQPVAINTATAEPEVLKQAFNDFIDRDSELNDIWNYKTIPDDHSSMLMKFLCHSAFYCQKDPDLMRDMLEASPFGQCTNVTAKWNNSNHMVHGQQYADYHIQKAIDGCTSVYEPNLSNAIVSATDTIPKEKFPDVKLNKDGNAAAKVLGTIPNLAFLLSFYKVFVCNNVISKTTTITGDDIPTELEMDNPMESALGLIYSNCHLNSLPVGNIELYLTNIASKNQTNPVVGYMNTLPSWDGVDYIKTLADGIHSYSSPSQVRITYKLLLMWLIQCVAAADYAATTPNTKAMPKFEHVLVFIGGQGINKTAWLNALLPAELKMYFKDGLSLNPNDKDSKEQATSFWIVELGELDATFRRADISALKAFLSERQDIYRKSYGKTAGTYKRRTSFCASVNDYAFLKDNTGNRRYWPIFVNSLDLLEDTGITHKQLWSQVWHLYLQGEQWWPTPAFEKELNDYRDGFSDNDRESELENLITSMFEDFTVANKDAAEATAKAATKSNALYKAAKQANQLSGKVKFTTVPVTAMSSTEVMDSIEDTALYSKHTKADINLASKILRKINLKPDGSPDINTRKLWRMPEKRKVV